ncbi:oxygenase MpaB family protein [Tellurirhabdus rosea]|uniref:oxygenase MpaB family protein n=1 Tax=Tellurirhabdus rosea TaxID=2674997 RepID=UPI002253FAF1|nr:oxygenase MpaB family protein [Tellurirhabdus rosea]
MLATAPYPPVYAKKLGLFRNPAVRDELRRLDPEKDYQRMVQLLVGYEFSFDITRALELALFHTYASPRISGLLARTGEFERRGQQRYDDTSMLISWFMQEGLDSEPGRRAIEQMNRIHGHYRIANDDYLLVLSTFVFYPIDWIARYGWRKLTAAEERALFLFWMEVGRRMHIQHIPATVDELRAFTDTYEANHFRYTESNRRIADATVRIVENWFPAPLRPLVQPSFAALISPKLREAFGYQTPPGWFKGMLQAAFWLRKWPLRYLTFESYPALIANRHYRSYRKGIPEIEELGPPQKVKS